MTVHFIGAGPGAPDLLTLRGRRLIAACDLCLYAGSLVPPEIVAFAPARAERRDTSSMTLEEIVAAMIAAARRGWDVVRLHSGDPSLYGATGEQMRHLRRAGVDYDVTPGVPAYAAAAAAMGVELTVPGGAQTAILTRTAMKATAMPQSENLERLAATRAALAIHLSIRNLDAVTRALEPHYGAEAPVAVAYRIGWPDGRVLRSTLGEMKRAVRREKITRTALILIGGGVDDRAAEDDRAASALYAASHRHLFRPGR